MGMNGNRLSAFRTLAVFLLFAATTALAVALAKDSSAEQKRMLSYVPMLDDFGPYENLYGFGGSLDVDGRPKRDDENMPGLLRFGRSDSIDKKEMPGVLRFGKRDAADMPGLLRFGKRSDMPGVLRFGKRSADMPGVYVNRR
ncbi:hypothetical protein M3Y99_00026500 [Aphelenchoides fujianensis]|nr:hypothetical protein M3Y99_00026500 [Aphelenchoides fujianensis]